jgi:hypothetical protein
MNGHQAMVTDSNLPPNTVQQQNFGLPGLFSGPQASLPIPLYGGQLQQQPSTSTTGYGQAYPTYLNQASN